MFYLLTPTETGSYTSSGPKPDLSSTIGNIFLTFVFAEFIYLYLVHKKNVHLSDVVGNLTSALCLLMTRFSGITSFFMKPYFHCFENYRVFKFSSEFFSSWLGWFACFLLVDLCYYWVHRLSHEINFVWGFHQVHHSSQHYNLTTALRQPVLHDCVTWIPYIGLAFIGIPPHQYLVHHDMNLLYQFWIHTEAIDRLPTFLELILNTPSHHRMHHGRNPRCIDTNYAGVLIIWDRLFGTFIPEYNENNDKLKNITDSRHKIKPVGCLNRTSIAYGLVHNLTSFSPTTVQFHHHFYVVKTLFSGLGYSKLKFMMFGPGYDGDENSPRLGRHETLPEPESPVKYLENVSFELGSYKMKLCVLLQMLTQFVYGEKAYKLAESENTWLSLRMVYVLVFVLQVETYCEIMDSGKYKKNRLCLLGLFLAGFYYWYFNYELAVLILPILSAIYPVIVLP